MDIQLRRGVLDACVLTVLMRGESYGYRLVRDVSEIIEITESTLYPILKRLEAASMLTVRTAEHDGRLRKYYHITAAGHRRIEEFKTEWKEVISIYQFVTKGDGEYA